MLDHEQLTLSIDTRPKRLVELDALDETGLRLRAIACFVLRSSELGRIGAIAKGKGYDSLVAHIEDLERRMQDGTS
jgi:hypothetical protein